MSAVPNRRDDEVRRLLDTPHPVVPADLGARAMRRGRRIVRRRRALHTTLWLLLTAALLTALALTITFWPHPAASTSPTDNPWWSPIAR
ncbi:hypothetical protein [Streptomyces sp. NBC_01190]|uniref:hypothetical protein n=1 Tax=Streptomyces sp. NBC_01190 TaxID=2903767 RepID=UPI0038653A50|nr:hypothetical protein OG519_22295 [Streptomyces sp. NBC_01190]